MPPKPLAVKLTIIEYNDIGIYQVGIYSTCELIKNRFRFLRYRNSELPER